MSCLPTGFFIVRGVFYDFTPSAFDTVGDDFAKRQTSVATLSQDRVVVVQKPKADVLRPGADSRFVQFQAWTATWNASAWMSREMHDHLTILNDADTPFWIQFDDYMSRNYATLQPADATGSTWLSPTYPTYPFNTTPIAPTSHLGNLFVDGIVQTTGYTIDNHSGAVHFSTPLALTAEVFLRYTWRAYVRIAQLDLTHIEGEQAPTMFIGRVVFEQLPANTADDPWPISIYTQDGCQDGDPGTAAPVVVGETCITPFRPQAASSVARSGSTVAFTNPTNIQYVDTSYAEAAGMGVGSKTQLLRAEPYTLPVTIPVGASLTRARLGIRGFVTPLSGVSFDAIDDEVYLRVGGVRVSTNKAKNTPIGVIDAWCYYDWNAGDLAGVTPASLNTGPVGVEAGFITNAYNPADFAGGISYLYSGVGYTAKPGTVTSAAWGSAGENTSVSVTSTDPIDGSVIAEESGTLTVVITYTGGGTPPPHVYVSVHSTANAGTDQPLQLTALADNGQGDPAVWGVGNDATSDGTHILKVDLIAGVGRVVLPVSASAARAYYASESADSPTASASVSVTATVVAAPLVTLEINAYTLDFCWVPGGGTGTGGTGTGGTGTGITGTGTGGTGTAGSGTGPG